MAGVSILDIIFSELQGSKVKYSALYYTSTCFSISLFPMIGLTAVSELWINSWSIDLCGTFICCAYDDYDIY